MKAVTKYNTKNIKDLDPFICGLGIRRAWWIFIYQNDYILISLLKIFVMDM
jgi:hypothetical protein